MASVINASSSGAGGLVSSGDSSGVLQLQNNGSTSVTLDTSGNVGIGNTPSSWATYKVAQVGGGTADVSVASNNDDTNISTNAYYNAGWKYQSSSTLAERYQQGAGTHRWYYAPSGTAGNAITWSEAMRIDSSGNLLIGYTSSNGSYKLQVNSQIFATSNTIATSDARYKENVEELSGALDIVKSLRPVSFDWKVHPIHNFDTKTKTVGFLAQDVQQTLAGKPYLNSIIKTNECVIEPEVKDENGTVTKEAVTEEFLGIAEGNMISILTAAIKELKAEFDAYVIAHP